jgi:SAM-dependent methyltransferase
LLGRVRHMVSEHRRRARNRRLAPEDLWRQELRREVGFWTTFVTTKGADWPRAWSRLVDPGGPVKDQFIKDKIALVDANPVKILDVGAGPLSVVGATYPGKELEITATDVLADEYDRMLAEAGVKPPVRTQRCRGEDLLEHFGPDRFDLVFARNSVDHSVDPLVILKNMLAVAKPGGFVLLRHYRNEGECQEYEGLHQWNFDVEGDRLLLWNERERHDVASVLGVKQDVEVAVREFGPDRAWVTCAMRKPAGVERAPGEAPQTVA